MFCVPIDVEDAWSVQDFVAPASDTYLNSVRRVLGSDLERCYNVRFFFSRLKWPTESEALVRSHANRWTASILVQVWTRWRPRADGHESCVEVFQDADPVLIDLLRLAPWTVWRYAVRRWEYSGLCDLLGSLLYDNGEFVRPSDCLALGSPRLDVIQALADDGWCATRPSDEDHVDCKKTLYF